jgi:hypothetical protein
MSPCSYVRSGSTAHTLYSPASPARGVKVRTNLPIRSVKTWFTRSKLPTDTTNLRGTLVMGSSVARLTARPVITTS